MATWLAELVFRIRALFAARRLDDELDSEMAVHLELLTREHLRRGMSPTEARRAAALRFGGAEQLKEHHRDHRGLAFVDTTLQDVRYALRALARNPAFAIVAVATLAIGIGAGTAVFSFAGSVLLRPLPFPDPDGVVRVFETNPLRRWTRNIASAANYADWRARNTVFTDIAAYEQFNSQGSGGSDVFLTGTGDPQALKALAVTGNLFTVLKAAPLTGRTFTDDETFEGKGRVAILSYGLWQSAFGGDPHIVGKPITLSMRTYDVVGVMPAAFFFPMRDVQVWLPVAYAPADFVNARRPHWLGVVARLAPGVSLEQAQQNMDAIAKDLEREYPDTNTQMGVRLERFHDSLAFEPAPTLRLLSGTVGVLFVLICVNTANLQLGRGLGRTRELAIRRALGAERRRLVRQLLTEALVVSVAGGVLGFGIAMAAQKLLMAYAADSVPLFAEVRLDWSVVVVAAVLSLLAPIAFGVVPALAASESGRLNERAESGSRSTGVVRHALIAGEVALAIVLVVSALLLVRSLARLDGVNPGFTAANRVAVTVALPTARYDTPAVRYQTFAAIEERIGGEPGVESVGAVSRLPLRGTDWTSDGTVEGRAPDDFERELRHKSVSPGYFRTAGVPLLAGRFFDDTDRRDQPKVTVVNQALADRYFRGEDPVGRRLKFGRPSDRSDWITIVGVVGDEKQDGLERPVEPEAFVPITQQLQNPMTFVVRSTLPPATVVAAIRRQVRAVDKDLVLTQVTTLDELVTDSTMDDRLRTTVIALFAAVALLLAGLGVYGVLAYAVSQRAREIGVRLALGARPSRVFVMVVTQGLRPVVVGAVVGIGGALWLANVARSLLFGVGTIDPLAYGAALVLLFATALIACVVPAWRAIKVSPLTALRSE